MQTLEAAFEGEPAVVALALAVAAVAWVLAQGVEASFGGLLLPELGQEWGA